MSDFLIFSLLFSLFLLFAVFFSFCFLFFSLSFLSVLNQQLISSPGIFASANPAKVVLEYNVADEVQKALAADGDAERTGVSP